MPKLHKIICIKNAANSYIRICQIMRYQLKFEKKNSISNFNKNMALIQGKMSWDISKI